LLLSSKNQPNSISLIENINTAFNQILNTVQFYEFDNLILLTESAKKLLQQLLTHNVGLTIIHISNLLSSVDAIRDIQNDIMNHGKESLFIYQETIKNIEIFTKEIPNLDKISLNKNTTLIHSKVEKQENQIQSDEDIINEIMSETDIEPNLLTSDIEQDIINDLSSTANIENLSNEDPEDIINEILAKTDPENDPAIDNEDIISEIYNEDPHDDKTKINNLKLGDTLVNSVNIKNSKEAVSTTIIKLIQSLNELQLSLADDERPMKKISKTLKSNVLNLLTDLLSKTKEMSEE